MTKLNHIIFISFLVCLLSKPSLGYDKDYPPYRFKDGPPKHLVAAPIVDLDKNRYTSKDGRIEVRLNETFHKALDFLLKDGDITLMRMDEDIGQAIPYAVYMADLDGNGLTDFLVLSNYRGCGLAARMDKVDIFLKVASREYRHISYDTLDSGIEDFFYLNNDGRYKVIITDMVSGQRHNYFGYSIYEFKDYKLENCDLKVKGFPKFVWFSFKPNDKDTTQLAVKEKLVAIRSKNNKIGYQSLKP